MLSIPIFLDRIGHAVLLDPVQDLRSVHLAQHDLRGARARQHVRHAPAVAVEHGQRVQVHVAVAHPGVQPEHDRVDPQRAVALLDALGPRSGSARVVDDGRRVLVGAPALGLRAASVQLRVALGTEHDLVGHGRVLDDVGELGIDEQDARPAVLQDVVDLGRAQPEVDRHEDPAVAAHAVERDEQPSTVLREHGHALSEADPERVELGRLRAAELRELPMKFSSDFLMTIERKEIKYLNLDIR